MKNHHLENFDLDPQKQLYRNSTKFQRNKIGGSFQSQMFRNQNQISDMSPSQTSQGNNLSKTKSRLKSTRIKSKNSKCIYYQLESTKKNQEQILRQQNIELKKVIAELKISQFYQINEGKLKSLIFELDEMKQKMKKIQKENQILRIQNDFLTRSNFQLKLDNSRLRKKYESNDSQTKIRKLRLSQLPERCETERKITNTQVFNNFPILLPDHLIISEKRAFNQYSKQMKTSQTDMRNQNASSRYRQEQLNGLLRIKSQKLLGGIKEIPSVGSSRILKQKKSLYTENQYDQQKFS